jgi:hypothetical protein
MSHHRQYPIEFTYVATLCVCESLALIDDWVSIAAYPSITVQQHHCRNFLNAYHGFQNSYSGTNIWMKHTNSQLDGNTTLTKAINIT